MTQDRKDSLIEKIQKLLNQAEGEGRIGNQAAAESFAAKANQLLIDHNLSKSEIDDFEAVGKDPVTQTSEEERIAYGLSKSDGTWEEDLIVVLARHNMCSVVFYTYAKKACVIGRADNIEVVRYMYGVLRRMIKDMSGPAYSNHTKKWQEKYPGYTQKELNQAGILSYRMPWVRSYLKGAVHGVNIKLVKDRRAAASDVREKVDALMVLNDNAIQAYKDKQFGELNNRRSTPASKASGFQQGAADGQGLSVARGVSGGSTPATKHLK